MERRKFTREFKLEAVRLIKDRGVSFAQASDDLGVHANAAARLGEAVGGRSATCVSWQGTNEAGAVGDRAAAPRGHQAEGGARHPKKAAAYFAKESM